VSNIARVVKLSVLADYKAEVVEMEPVMMVTLKMTETQKCAVKQLFADNGWLFAEEASLPVQDTLSHTENSGEESNSTGNTDEGGDFDPGKYEPGFVIKQGEGDECPHCLCTPCITNERNRQRWWPHAPRPNHRLNSLSRKTCYKSFWTMLYHRRVWLDARYITRKRTALGLDPQQNRDGWIHRRDLMPDCVLKLVRGWYPNVENQPYMGHHWE
jgi:hypothetical protein